MSSRQNLVDGFPAGAEEVELLEAAKALGMANAEGGIDNPSDDVITRIAEAGERVRLAEAAATQAKAEAAAEKARAKNRWPLARGEAVDAIIDTYHPVHVGDDWRPGGWLESQPNGPMRRMRDTPRTMEAIARENLAWFGSASEGQVPRAQIAEVMSALEDMCLVSIARKMQEYTRNTGLPPTSVAAVDRDTGDCIPGRLWGNGAVSTAGGTPHLTPAEPSWIPVWPAVAYDWKDQPAATLVWDAFIASTGLDADFLLSRMGRAIQIDVGDDTFDLLTGDGGCGKGTVLNLLKTILGADAVAEQASVTELSSQFGLMGLDGKVALLLPDMPDSRRLTREEADGVNKLKLLSGGASLDGDRKYSQTLVTIWPLPIWCASNHKPRWVASSGDITAWRRRTIAHPMRQKPSAPDESLGKKLALEAGDIAVAAVLAWVRRPALPAYSIAERESIIASSLDPLLMWCMGLVPTAEKTLLKDLAAAYDRDQGSKEGTTPSRRISTIMRDHHNERWETVRTRDGTACYWAEAPADGGNLY